MNNVPLIKTSSRYTLPPRPTRKLGEKNTLSRIKQWSSVNLEKATELLKRKSDA